MKKIIMALALMSSVVSVVAQTSVTEYDYTKGMSSGIVYALPRVELEVCVNVEKKVYTPGPFSQYAERFLALSGVSTEAKVEWNVVDVWLERRVVADNSRMYEVAPDRKGAADRVVLSPEGIILGVNARCAGGDTDGENKKYEVVECRYPSEPLFDMSVLNEETLMATSMPKMAELAAKQIYRIRESRAAIMACETEQLPDGRALEAILARWERDENSLIALFAGCLTTTAESVSYRINPKGDMKNHVVARLSIAEGLVAADDVIGDPIYIDVKGFYPSLPVAPVKNKKPSVGFAYCVPGRAEVQISYKGKTLDSERIVVPQFGYVARLSADITNRVDCVLLFDPTSGGIVAVKNEEKR